MVCASAIESERILLNSADATFPQGIGNSAGQLGRYFMDQTPTVSAATLRGVEGEVPPSPAPVDDFYATTGGVFVPRFTNLDGGTAAGFARGFARGFAFQGVLGRMHPHDGEAPSGGLMGFGEMLPYADNTIRIDPRRRDRWGVPIPVVTCRMHENERRLLGAQTGALREILEAAGHRST